MALNMQYSCLARHSLLNFSYPKTPVSGPDKPVFRYEKSPGYLGFGFRETQNGNHAYR